MVAEGTNKLMEAPANHAVDMLISGSFGYPITCHDRSFPKTSINWRYGLDSEINFLWGDLENSFLVR
jgi:hypothetical protein